MNRMIKVTLAAVAISSPLAACSSGALNGFDPDPMATVLVSKHPDAGPMTTTEWAQLARMAEHCQEDINTEGSGVVESALTQGALSGIGAATGTGGGIAAGMPEAGIGRYTIYGGVAGVGAGVIGGVQQNAQNRASWIGNCAGRHFVNPRTQGVNGRDFYVQGSFIRTRNRTEAPSWVVEGNQPLTTQSAPPTVIVEDDDMAGAQSPR